MPNILLSHRLSRHQSPSAFVQIWEKQRQIQEKQKSPGLSNDGIARGKICVLIG